MRTWIVRGLAAGLCGGLLILAGCEDGGWNHTPPDGMGTLIVDNRTLDDLDVYVNGSKVYSVSDYTHELVDLAPGVYRVVIDEEHGYRTYRDDIDVLDGKLTVLNVQSRSGSGYDVDVYFD